MEGDEVQLVSSASSTCSSSPNEVQTKLYEKDGQVSPVRTTLGFWVSLPLVGSIIRYLKMQEAR
jgi:hypothetical protein